MTEILLLLKNLLEFKKNKIYKHMPTNSESVYFNVLNYIVGEYYNTYHKTIKVKPIDVKSDSFDEYNEESNEKDPKSKVNDHVRFQSTKIFLLMYMLLTGVRAFL